MVRRRNREVSIRYDIKERIMIIMKAGLIRLTDNKDIFYDSIEKTYRYRMCYQNCKQAILPCICYNKLDSLLKDIEEGINNYTCSSKCAVLAEGMSEEIIEIMQELGFDTNIKLEDLTEKQANEIMNDIYENNDSEDSNGKLCDI